MDEEIEQINVEPEFPFNPFEDCPDDGEEDNVEKIDNETTETDALNLFTFTKSGKKRPESNTKKCIYCDKIYKKKYMATHLRVIDDWLYSDTVFNFLMDFLIDKTFRHIQEKSP